MNRWILKTGILLLFINAFTLACNNEDDNTPSSTNDTLTNGGNWKVTYYFDKDKEETSDFAGYTFVFENGGAFKSTKNGTTTTGTWQVDNSSNKLIINAGVATKPLQDLSDDWIITEKSAKVIKLRDDRTDSDGDEFLTFEVL